MRKMICGECGQDLTADAALATANERIRAEREAMAKQEPVVHQFQDKDGKWYGFMNQQHYENTLADGRWPIRALFASPVPIPEGYALVPKEPTPEMLTAGRTEFSQWGMMQAEATWHAMIAAAPKRPTSTEGGA